MIAHLTTSHQNILNSYQIKDFLNWSRAANSTVHGWIQPNFKLIRDYIVVLVTCKNEEDPIINEGSRVLTSLLFDFSDAQGQLTPKTVVQFRRNSNSSKLLLAHLSRRLIGELIVYQWSGVRPSSVVVRRRPSSTMLKHLLLRNRLADQSQILCGASLGRGNEILFVASGSHDQDGRHAHIW